MSSDGDAGDEPRRPGKSRTGRKPSKSSRKEYSKQMRERTLHEITELERVLREQAPPLDVTPDQLKAMAVETCFAAATAFAQLPLSSATKKALAEANFVQETAIQRLAIPHALVGRNVVGLAKTGSGKTLAFLVPLIEALHRAKWTNLDGVGAIVVSPTRELAMQTFEVLKVLAKHHPFSGGLMIGGGMDVLQERSAAASYAIIVCTPGRLLQQLDEAYDLRCDGLKMVVFDECDRLLDMGFQPTVDAILQHLPPITNGNDGLQCLMFSATGNKVLVSERITAAEFVEVDVVRGATPKALSHYVMHVGLDEKTRTLWSFVKQHTKTKMIIFVSSCKQARYLEEVFRKLGPGVWLSTIHGRMSQAKRIEIYYQFREALFACLIATDVAARGLDFLAVDWVVQVDCPEDVNSYIHRAGRTARIGDKGNSLLFLMPSEAAFQEQLKAKGIELQEVHANDDKIKDPQAEIQGLVAKDADLKYLAQKAFISYMRSVYLAADKSVFSIEGLPYKEFARSLGLLSVPKIKFGKSRASNKNVAYAAQRAGERDSVEDEDEVEQQDEQEKEEEEEEDRFVPVAPAKTTKMERLLHRKPVAGKLSAVRNALRDEEAGDADAEGSDEWLVTKRVDHELDEDDEQVRELAQAHKKRQKLRVDAVEDVDWTAQGQQHAVQQRTQLQRADGADKLNAKQRRRERLKQMQMERRAKKAQGSDAPVAVLASPSRADAVPKALEDREAMALALLNGL